MKTEELSSLIASELNVYSTIGHTYIFPYIFPSDIPLKEPTSDLLSKTSNSSSGDPSPIPPKQIPEQHNHIVSPKQWSSVFPSLFTPHNTSVGPHLYPTSDPSDVPSYIPSDDYPNILLYSFAYVPCNHFP